MDTANLVKAIEVRCSRRKYQGTPIESNIVAKLQEAITEYNRLGNVRMELVTNNGKAFKGITKSYGMFSGVNDYIGLVASKNDSTNLERIGYFGELVVLHATAMGLGTCWAGGSRSDMPFSLGNDEAIVCSILLGNVDKEESFKERLMKSATHLKTKSAEDMFTSKGSIPNWFLNGMKAVQKAPSAVNRQPVMFSFENGKVSATVKDISNTLMAIDFGIAKLHFELGAGGGKWEWGNGGIFTHEPAN